MDVDKGQKTLDSEEWTVTMDAGQGTGDSGQYSDQKSVDNGRCTVDNRGWWTRNSGAVDTEKWTVNSVQ